LLHKSSTTIFAKGGGGGGGAIIYRCITVHPVLSCKTCAPHTSCLKLRYDLYMMYQGVPDELADTAATDRLLRLKLSWCLG
jgi:hypothetical protein